MHKKKYFAQHFCKKKRKEYGFWWYVQKPQCVVQQIHFSRLPDPEKISASKILFCNKNGAGEGTLESQESRINDRYRMLQLYSLYILAPSILSKKLNRGLRMSAAKKHIASAADIILTTMSCGEYLFECDRREFDYHRKSILQKCEHSRSIVLYKQKRSVAVQGIAAVLSSNFWLRKILSSTQEIENSMVSLNIYWWVAQEICAIQNL